MKRLLCSAVLLAALTACGSNASTASPEHAGISQATVDTVFIDTLKGNTLAFDEADDAVLIDLAHKTCDAFGRNATFEQAVAVFTVNGYSSSDAGSFIGVSVAAYCPEYSYLYS